MLKKAMQFRQIKNLDGGSGLPASLLGGSRELPKKTFICYSVQIIIFFFTSFFMALFFSFSHVCFPVIIIAHRGVMCISMSWFTQALRSACGFYLLYVYVPALPLNNLAFLFNKMQL